MHVRKPCWQSAVAAEGEDQARRTEDVAGDETEGGDGCARKQDGATDVAEKFRGGFGQWRIFVSREIAAECALRHELDHDVNDRSDDECEISGARNGARWILHFAA